MSTSFLLLIIYFAKKFKSFKSSLSSLSLLVSTKSEDSWIIIWLILSTKRFYCDVKSPSMALTWVRCLWINFYRSSSLSTCICALRRILLYFEPLILSKSVCKRLLFSIFFIWLISRVKVFTSPLRFGSFGLLPNLFKN